VTEQGNFADPHTGFRANVLHLADPHAPPTPAIERGRAALFARRETRVRPGRDDKVLLSWNALMLRALAEAAAALDRDDWFEAARTNARFLLDEMRRPDGRFLRSWRAPYLAYAEDYAALLEALCTLVELDDIGWLADARAVADDLLRLFGDADAPGFFTTGNDAETLVVRAKDLFDDATPSANSLAANGLLRLAALTGEPRYEAPAIAVLEMLARPMASHATAFAHLLAACERAITPPIEIAIVGDAGDTRTKELRHEVAARLIPASVVLTGDARDDIPLLAQRERADGKPTAYVCEHYACRLPVTTSDELRAEIEAALARRQRAAT
jgi:uncharacterized protein YyaL (SSP411 family)